MTCKKLVEGTHRSWEESMTIGDYPAAGTPYWLTMAGVALGLVGRSAAVLLRLTKSISWRPTMRQ
jgi:hypothetical protein